MHSHYSYYNVSSETQVACRRLFEVGAFLCELFVFAYLGLQVATMNHAFDFGLFFSGIPLAVLSRAVMIVPCTKLINRYRKNKLPDNMMHMMLAVGLRGAVAYGLVVNMPSGHERGEGQEGLGIPAIETATLLIAVGICTARERSLAHSIARPPAHPPLSSLFPHSFLTLSSLFPPTTNQPFDQPFQVASSLVLGSATGPLLKHFDLEGKSDAEVYRKGWEDARARGEVSDRDEQHYDTSPSKVHSRFKEIDNAVLKPVFGGKSRTGGVVGVGGMGGGTPGDTEILLPS